MDLRRPPKPWRKHAKQYQIWNENSLETETCRIEKTRKSVCGGQTWISKKWKKGSKIWFEYTFENAILTNNRKSTCGNKKNVKKDLFASPSSSPPPPSSASSPAFVVPIVRAVSQSRPCECCSVSQCVLQCILQCVAVRCSAAGAVSRSRPCPLRGTSSPLPPFVITPPPSFPFTCPLPHAPSPSFHPPILSCSLIFFFTQSWFRFWRFSFSFLDWNAAQ